METKDCFLLKESIYILDARVPKNSVYIESPENCDIFECFFWDGEKHPECDITFKVLSYYSTKFQRLPVEALTKAIHFMSKNQKQNA